MVERCEKHLVYLGFGIFLRLVKVEPVVLGTLMFDTPQTQQQFLQQTFTSTTSTPPTGHQKSKHMPTAAAGSIEQLHDSMDVPVKQETDDRPSSKPKSFVTTLPFEVRLTRLTKREILKYTSPSTTKGIKKGKRPKIPSQTVSSRASLVCTRSKTRTSIKWKIIYSHPSKHQSTSTGTFKVRTHTLRKTKQNIYQMSC